MTRRLVSLDEAVPVDQQHSKPCSDCPWARSSLNDWLGGDSCHTLKGPQCAGAAIYRSNVYKRPRDRGAMLLPADRVNVFAMPAEFTIHHQKAPKR